MPTGRGRWPYSTIVATIHGIVKMKAAVPAVHPTKNARRAVRPADREKDGDEGDPCERRERRARETRGQEKPGR